MKSTQKLQFGVERSDFATGGSPVDDIGTAAAQDLTVAVVAVGFRALKPNNKYRYFWLYRVKFGIPATNLKTKGDSITFQTPTVEGTVMRRNKPDGMGQHPLENVASRLRHLATEVIEDDAGVAAQTIATWYDEVYAPVWGNTPPPPEEGAR